MKFNILHTEWSSGWGGQEQRIILECRKVMELGHHVVIAGQPGSGIIGRARDAGISVEELTIRQSYDPKAMLDTCRLIRKHEITVVNTHSGKDTWACGLAARFCRTPLFVRTRHLAVPISSSPFNFIQKLADGIVTTGEAVRSALIEDNGISPERVVSIPTGVSLERFTPEIDGSAVRHEFGIVPEKRVVTILAILRKVKRHDLFLEAARILRERYPDLVFLVVGDGPMLDDIVARRKALGLEGDVILAGHREDVPQLFALSDVVVLTSDMEGVPQSLSQAMAMERPVVAAPVGGIPDLVRDRETGLFAEAGNAASFAARIAELLDTSSLRAALGAAARRHVLDNFTDTIMVQRTIEFYERLAALRQNGKGR